MSESTFQFFRSPFTPAYWRAAFRELKNPRSLILAALFIALELVVSSFYIPIPVFEKRIYFSFFVKALGGTIYGPIMGLLTGFVGDILGCILHPTGAFFPGYTLTAVMGSFLQGLFFYRAKPGLLRVILARLTVVLVCNIGLNCLWSAILFGKGYYYYLVTGLAKVGILFPFEVALLFLFLRLMQPVLERAKLLPPRPAPAPKE